MGKLTFVTGGARSGKSNFAESLMREAQGKTAYIATAIPFDKGMQDRIKKHQQHRPSSWKTIERYKNYQNLKKDPAFVEADNILYDCLTVMVTNQLMDMDIDWDSSPIDQINQAEEKIKEDVSDLIDLLKEKNSIVVSNEIGMGIVPVNYFANYFRDILGRINQYVAQQADEVYFTVSGIPMKVK